MLQAQSDDDDVGDDVAVNVDTGGFMDEFFEQVSRAVCLFTLHRGPRQRRRPSIYLTGFTANTESILLILITTCRFHKRVPKKQHIPVLEERHVFVPSKCSFFLIVVSNGLNYISQIRTTWQSFHLLIF